MNSWDELTELTKGKEFVVSKVKLKNSNIQIEGEFELPELAKLKHSELIFISAFIKTHGSIKEMEKLFGISYPTVKNKLKEVSGKLGFIVEETSVAINNNSDVLDMIKNGELSVEEALKRMK